MVKKSDWKTLEMPGQTAKFVINMTLNDDEKECIKEGRRHGFCTHSATVNHRSGSVPWNGICLCWNSRNPASLLSKSTKQIITGNLSIFYLRTTVTRSIMEYKAPFKT
ncbi:MAG: hypothetical protein HFH67_03360 [Lachnospiraceae bacterium]|nr:hypothetical protein [Lachnospiraceae bacterium]